MNKIQTVAVSEAAIEAVVKQLEELEACFDLNHPTRVLMSDVRSKLGGVIKVNRQDKNEAQTKWVYVVESDVRL